MDNQLLQAALGPLVEEVGFGTQRMETVFAEQEAAERVAYDAVRAAKSNDEYQAAWQHYWQVCAQHDKTMDVMAGWLEQGHERVIGAYFQAKAEATSSS